MLPLYAALTGGFLAWYRARKLKKSVQGVPWAEQAYGVLYDAEDESFDPDDKEWEYNLNPIGIQEWALGYGVQSPLYYAQADTHAYTMAYNEGHRDARNQSGYKPDIDSRLDKVAFRDAYKLRAESVVSGKKKGKVISMIGSDPRLRKLKKDKDITPEEASTRLDISAEPNKSLLSIDHHAQKDYKNIQKDLNRFIKTLCTCKHSKGAPSALNITTSCGYCGEEIDEVSFYGLTNKVDSFDAETNVECLFCPEMEGLIEIDLEGYPEYVCEHCLDPDNWDTTSEESYGFLHNAENWGGDPEGPLAKALAKARASLKNKKPLNISKLPDKDQKSLDEFNGAVVWKEPKGIVEKVMVREMAMQQLRLNEAILELEQHIRLGMITEEEAFRKIVAMSQ